MAADGDPGAGGAVGCRFDVWYRVVECGGQGRDGSQLTRRLHKALARVELVKEGRVEMPGPKPLVFDVFYPDEINGPRVPAEITSLASNGSYSMGTLQPS